LTARTWLRDQLMLSRTRNLRSFLNSMRELGTTGLRISKIGASPDNFGGVIEFRFTWLLFQVSSTIQMSTITITMLLEEVKKKPRLLLLKNSSVIQKKFHYLKMRMFLIHGSHQVFSHSPLWDGLTTPMI